jgi:hypothetical protein
VPFPAGEELIAAAEEVLGRRLPSAHRARLLHDNGGDIQVKGYPGDDPGWTLHPVRDRSDRRRLKRTMADIVTETDAAREWRSFPADAIAVAENGTADRIVLTSSGSYAWWDHETGETAPVVVIWNE